MSNRKRVKDPNKTPRSVTIAEMRKTLAELEVIEQALIEKEAQRGEG